MSLDFPKTFGVLLIQNIDATICNYLESVAIRFLKDQVSKELCKKINEMVRVLRDMMYSSTLN